MRIRFLGILTIAAMLTASLAMRGLQPVSAEEATTEEPHPGMVIEDDVVSEWKIPKLTEMTRLTDLARATETAKDKPVIIFKHSTTCPISGRAAQRMDTMLNECEETLPAFYMVKVIESRPVSNAIADQYEVKHESPQILLLKDGKAVWNTSHHDITEDALMKALAENDLLPEAKDDSEG